MATPTAADRALQINSSNNNNSILTVDGRYRITTASPTNEIVLSGCNTVGSGNGVMIYWLTTTWYNYQTTGYINTHNLINHHSRTFSAPSNGIRPLYGSNSAGAYDNSSTNLGQAKNNGGSAYYYVYVANLPGGTTPCASEFYLCNFTGTNNVTGVSSNYLTVTWNSALPTPTLHSGSTSYGNFSTSNTANTLESGNEVVLRKDDTGYAIDLDVGTTSSDNVWYATTYNSTTTAGVSNPLSGNVGRTFNLAGNTTRARLEPVSTTNRITTLPTEGYYQLYRLWGRIYPGTSGYTNTTNGKYWDGLYYQKGVTYTTYHPDTSVTVNGGTNATVNISATDTQADVTVAGISSSDQNGYQWRYNNVYPSGQAAGTLGAGNISPTSHNIPISANLPTSGNTRRYYLHAKNFLTNGNTGQHTAWVYTGNYVDVTRAAAASYSVSGPSSGSVNEGATLTFTITTSNITNGTTVPWTLGGTLQSGEYTTSASSPATIQNNSATIDFNITADNVADGNKTATLTLGSTDSAGNSTGGASASITVVDTSNPGGGGGSGSGTGGGSAGTYGLKIQNINGTETIIDDTSRLTNFLATDFINTNSDNYKDMFMTFDCSDKTETGFLVTWSGAIYSTPSITRHGATSLTITATTAGTNKVTLTGSTSDVYNSMPVYIASNVGGLYANTLYYVKNKNSSGTSIELSLTDGGSTVALSTTVLTTNPMTQVAMIRAGIRVTKNGNDTTSTQSGIANVELVRY